MQLPDFRLPEIKVPHVRVPSVRVPSLRVHGLRRPRLDVDDPGRLSSHLQFFFYLLMFVALLAIFAGATWFHITGITPSLSAASSEAALAAVRAAKERGESRRVGKSIVRCSAGAATRGQSGWRLREIGGADRSAERRLASRRSGAAVLRATSSRDRTPTSPATSPHPP